MISDAKGIGFFCMTGHCGAYDRPGLPADPAFSEVIPYNTPYTPCFSCHSVHSGRGISAHVRP